jgi:hypothetical protein
MAYKDPLKAAYNVQKNNAKRRGIPFRLTFKEWVSWWKATGKLEQRGRGKDGWVMARKNDEGAYEIGNIVCVPGPQNVSEGNVGREVSESARQRIAAAQRNMEHPWVRGDLNPMHRPECKAAISAQNSGHKHYAAKKCVTPHGAFGSASDAAKALGLTNSCVERRCTNPKPRWADWYYEEAA